MTFTDAVRSCFIKYADFNGCSSRPEYWWWSLFTLIGTLALQVVDDHLSLAFGIATLLPGFAVTSRRLHDTDRSGWWQLLWLIPLLGWIFIVVWCSQEGRANRYGEVGRANV